MKSEAAEMERIGDNIAERNAAAAAAITKLPPPGADSMSELLSEFFVAQGQQYRVHAARAEVLHMTFVRSVIECSNQLEDAEDQNRYSIQDAGPSTSDDEAAGQHNGRQGIRYFADERYDDWQGFDDDENP